MKYLKLLALVISVALIDISILTGKVLKIDFKGGYVLETSIAITILIFSLLFLVFGSYKILMKPINSLKNEKTSSREETIKFLKIQKDNAIFDKDVIYLLKQEIRFKEKKEAIIESLKLKFDVNELTYSKFLGVVNNVEDLFYVNVSNFVNKINSFDVKEYRNFKRDSSRLSDSVKKEKNEIYQSYFDQTKKSININEEILVDLDKLLFEINSVNNEEIHNFEEIECVKELNLLIDQTKLYK